jgi:hypothetical protein
VELVFGIAFVVLLVVFAGVGLAFGAGAEGPDPGPPGLSPLKLRATRAVLLAIAAFMAVLGAEAALVAGWQQDPSTGRAEALVFLLEAAVDLGLALLVLMPAWTLRRVWVIRLVAACWIVVGPIALVLTFGSGPAATFYLNLGPDSWAGLSVVAGAVLVWLSSLGGGDLAAAADSAAMAPAATAPPSAPSEEPPAPPTRWRGIVTGVALASLVAISCWPLAQFAGVNALGGCTPQWLVPGNPNFCVTGKVDLQMQLAVSGQTTLADGAFVTISISGGNSAASDPRSEQRVSVNGGKFQATFDLNGQTAGPVTVLAIVQMAGQPAAVVQAYGADGHALSGPTVLAEGSDGPRSLQVTLHFDLGS